MPGGVSTARPLAGGDAELKRAPNQSSSVDYSVDIVDLCKSFKRKTIARGSYTTFKSALLGIFSGKRNSKEAFVTHAVKDLTVRIPKGASFGVIGRNGSGKSTLLKLITGIYKPDTGHIKLNGRVAALIELGAGFHPDFSGRENLYLGGVMHGLTREEIDSRFDEIVDFAELREVIDDPVRTYSSGMFMRLGFSLAVHTDPDVLIVDEVLAVGDAAFVSKCKERIAELRRTGKTLILVTHDLDAVARWCDEVLWLNRGEVKDRGEPRRVIDHYLQFIEKGEEEELFEEASEAGETETAAATEDKDEQEQARWGSREVEITAARLLGSDGKPKLLFHEADACTIEIDYVMRENAAELVFGIGINRSDGVTVHGTNTDIERVELPQPLPKSGTVRYRVSRLSLLEGNFSIDIAAHRKDGYPYDYQKGAIKFAVRSHFKQVGVVAPEHSWEFS